MDFIAMTKRTGLQLMSTFFFLASLILGALSIVAGCYIIVVEVPDILHTTQLTVPRLVQEIVIVVSIFMVPLALFALSRIINFFLDIDDNLSALQDQIEGLGKQVDRADRRIEDVRQKVAKP